MTRASYAIPTRSLLIALVAILAGCCIGAPAASAATIWVDPVRGNDARSGATATTAIRTLQEAWDRIPRGRTLTQPYTVNLRAGIYPTATSPNYWELRRGTASAPIRFRSVDGPGRAQLPNINMFGVHWITFDGVRIRSQFIAYHCERCSHVTLTRSAFVGVGDHHAYQGPQETIKVNQSSDVTITDSYIAGATDNALDLVAVHRARILRNTIAHALDWCAYAKGGSDDVRFIGNHVYGCGTGGFTAGQGTGFEFMVAPWLHYEAYGMHVANNVVHDVEGAAFGVNGGYGVQVAGNTAYRVGTRDHLLEVVFGERSCDGNAAGCTRMAQLGGWGPRAPGSDPQPIGDSDVAIAHNLIVNPNGVRSAYTHFAVYGPRTATAAGMPATQVTDRRLRILGNVIWDGPGQVDLGLGEGDQGCQPAHATCAPALVRPANNINRVRPTTRVVLGKVPVAEAGTDAGTGTGITLPAIIWSGLPARPAVTPVAMPSRLGPDRAGRARTAASPPGAYTGQVPLSLVTVHGAGSGGSVTARSVRACTASPCPVRALRGDWVELRAAARSGYRFAGWAGACSRQAGAVCLVRTGPVALTTTAVFRRTITLEP